MIDKIYETLTGDPYILAQVGDRIKYYEYPAAADMKDTHIIIDPLDASKPGDYGDNEILTDDYLLQVEVWSKNRKVRDELARRVRKLLRGIGVVQYGGGFDEYDKDYAIYRDARRYRGKEYTPEFNT